MILTADYHTHTPYSHGKNTVLENAQTAKEKGLLEVGITDHGFSHLAFGLKRRKVDRLKEECAQASKLTGVRVLVGMEANLLDDRGTTDMKESDYKNFDLFLCGKHVLVGYKNAKAWWRYFGGNFVADKFHKKPSERLVEYNTRAYIAMLEKNPVDILTHLAFLTPAEVKEVGKCAGDVGTYIELNSKKEHLTDEQLYALLDTSCRFVIDSDAHSKERVGEIELVKKQLERVAFPLERIDNIDGRLPKFRFAEYKKKTGLE